jgi:hypothetical protein
VTLMDLALAQLRLASFSQGAETYELVGPTIKVYPNGTVEQI